MKPPSSKSLLAYRAIQCQIKIGDVTAFSSTDIPSGLVKLATQSTYVHVAIASSTASRDSLPAGDRPDAVLIAESHIDTLSSATTHSVCSHHIPIGCTFRTI